VQTFEMSEVDNFIILQLLEKENHIIAPCTFSGFPPSQRYPET
jgi:hypothetical protein